MTNQYSNNLNLENFCRNLVEDFPTDIYQKEIGLYGGFTGRILFEHIADSFFRKDESIPKFNASLEYIEGYLFEREYFSPYFAYGLSGVGWLVDYICGDYGLKEKSVEFMYDIDEALVAFLNNYSNPILELIGGVLGVGVYFIKRKNQKQVTRILAIIEDQKKKVGNSIFWFSDSPSQHLGKLGLAHGNTGVLYYLYKCFINGLLPKKYEYLLYQAIDFWREYTQIDSNCWNVSEYLNEDLRTTKGFFDISPRWCSSIFSSLYVLYLSCISTRDFSYSKVVLEKLRLIARENIFKVCSTNPWLCHGSSGIGLIFLNLYQLTKDKIFLDASYESVNKTLDLLKNQYPTDENGNTGLLSGVAGVGLYFLSILNFSQKNDWDECLFLK